MGLVLKIAACLLAGALVLWAAFALNETSMETRLVMGVGGLIGLVWVGLFEVLKELRRIRDAIERRSDG